MLDQGFVEDRKVRTVLVGMPESAAVLYGIDQDVRTRAIVAFPLVAASAFFRQSLADQPPRLRYNATTPTWSLLALSLRTQ